MFEKEYLNGSTEIATFAGGCFWCMEPPFRKLEGVRDVKVGYTGGEVEHPTYEQVVSGSTGHVEAIQIHFDPDSISYQNLLDVFWMNVDPTDPGGQFADRGYNYSTGIFYHSGKQQKLAKASKKALENSGRFEKPIATKIKPYLNFYPAEDYHQEYYKKSPFQYKMYKELSGRADFIRRTWN